MKIPHVARPILHRGNDLLDDIRVELSFEAVYVPDHNDAS